MMSEVTERWAEVFAILGSEERLSILFALQGSLYVQHKHTGLDAVDDDEDGCLSFSQIGEASEIHSSTRLSYHISKLIGADLIRKLPHQDKSGRVFPLYSVTRKWKSFSTELGIDKIIQSQIRRRYPNAFIEPR